MRREPVKPSRGAPRRRSTAVNPKAREDLSQRVLEQTLRVVLAHFKGEGVTLKQQRAALNEALRRVHEPLQRHEASSMHATRARVALLAAWHRDAHYLNDDGEPLALPLIGSPSLTELFEKFLPTSDPAGLTATLEREGMLLRAGRSVWRPARRTLLMPKHADSTMERVPFLLNALLSTLAHNGRAGQSDEYRLERTVFVDRLPVSSLGHFDRRTKQVGGAVVDDLDNWLLQRELPAHTSEPTVSAGVSLFAYVEPNELTTKAPPRRRRRSAKR